MLAFLGGVVVGMYVWHRAVLRAIAEMHAELEETEQTENNDVIECYTERDENVLRLYEVTTDRFLAQGSDAIAVVRAFADRFPERRIFLAETDEDVILELGLNPDDYEFGAH